MGIPLSSQSVEEAEESEYYSCSEGEDAFIEPPFHNSAIQGDATEGTPSDETDIIPDATAGNSVDSSSDSGYLTASEHPNTTTTGTSTTPLGTGCDSAADDAFGTLESPGAP